MDKIDLAVTFFSELSTAEQLLQHKMQQALPKNMAVSHFSLLNYLVQTGEEKTPAQLAKVFNLTKAALTNTIKRLDHEGYLLIRPDWDDARKKWIMVSPAGFEAHARAMRSVQPLFDKVTTGLGEQKLKTAMSIMRDLRQLLD